MVSKASDIPRPARNTGVRPILGLMVVPMNGPTGDSYAESRLETQTNSLRGVSDPGARLFLKITGRLDSEENADVVDPLEQRLVRMHVAQSERVIHLAKILRRCVRLPEIDQARVNDGVFQNGDSFRYHMGRLQVGEVSRDECTEQGGHRDWVNLDPIRR